MGDNIPIANGTNSDSLMVLNPKTGKWTLLARPLPDFVLSARAGRAH